MKMLLKLQNIIECIVIKRVNRFIVSVVFNGKEVEAYINNTGRLTDYIVKG